jgi:hypothetical protein
VSSIREQALAAILTALTGATDAGVRVYRRHVLPPDGSPWPSIAIKPVREECDAAQRGHYTTHRLAVLITVYGRTESIQDVPPDQAADAVCAAVHAALMADETLGGLVMRTSLTATDWSFDEDPFAGMVGCTYELMYSTRRESLTERP